MSESASGETCGFVEPEEHLPPDYEEVTCERPVWKYERCIWHEDLGDRSEDEKPVDELKKSLEEHDGRIDGALLSGLEAAGTTFLSDRELIYADFSGANFEEADLSGVNLYKSDFGKANLGKAILAEADLTEASLKEADLVEAQLSGVDLSGAVLVDTDLSRADLTDTTLEGTLLRGTVDFTEAILPGADFSRTAQGDPEDSEHHGDDSEFEEEFEEGSEFGGVVLSEAVLEEAVFYDMDLEGTDFEEADLIDADFREADVREANFERARLVRADFLGSDLRNARLYQAHLADAQINSDTVCGEECIYESEEYAEEFDEEGAEEDREGSHGRQSALEAAAWQYRKLEELHREQALSRQAGEFHKKKEEAKFKKYWEDPDPPKVMIQLFNRYISSHGESPLRVVGLSLILIVALAVLYPVPGIVVPAANSTTVIHYGQAIQQAPTPAAGIADAFAKGLYFSVVTFTTLGYGDVQPANLLSQGFAMLESFAGALLMAYLVFVLGRRVRR